MIGINLSGAEFGSGDTYGSDYRYPSASELDYYVAHGVELVRLPFKWDRMQPTLGGALAADELGRLKTFLADAAAQGVKVIIDCHSYGRYEGQPIGSAAVSYAQFADFWKKLASAVKDSPALAGYDIMNEPHSMGGADRWPTAAQAAVDAIRTVDMTTPIYIEGDQWAGAHSWLKYNANLLIDDPANKIIYQAHQYFDRDSSGKYTESYDASGAYPDIGVARVQPFLDWLEANNVQGFIGEFGAPTNDPRWNEVTLRFLDAIVEAGVGGTIWGGGFLWSSTYKMALGEAGKPESLLLPLLEPYFEMDFAAPEPTSKPAPQPQSAPPLESNPEPLPVPQSAPAPESKPEPLPVSQSAPAPESKPEPLPQSPPNAAPVINDVTASVAENVESGRTLVMVPAIDPNAGDVLSYAIIGGNPAALFAIDAATGAVSLAAGQTLDYETAGQHHLTVAARDPFGLSDTAAVTIAVTDVVETAASAVGNAIDAGGGILGASNGGVDTGGMPLAGGAPDSSSGASSGNVNEGIYQNEQYGTFSYDIGLAFGAYGFTFSLAGLSFAGLNWPTAASPPPEDVIPPQEIAVAPQEIAVPPQEIAAAAFEHNASNMALEADLPRLLRGGDAREGIFGSSFGHAPDRFVFDNAVNAYGERVTDLWRGDLFDPTARIDSASGAAGQLRSYADASNTIVPEDFNGNAATDFQMSLIEQLQLSHIGFLF